MSMHCFYHSRIRSALIVVEIKLLHKLVPKPHMGSNDYAALPLFIACLT